MKPIKMNRVDLLEIVKHNKQKHSSEFDQAVEDYKKLVLSLAQSNLKIAKTQELGEFKQIKIIPPAPVSYEDSYKRAIRMLELSVDEVIEVDETVFNQLVQDEWDWKRGFVATASMYKTAI